MEQYMETVLWKRRRGIDEESKMKKKCLRRPVQNGGKEMIKNENLWSNCEEEKMMKKSNEEEGDKEMLKNMKCWRKRNDEKEGDKEMMNWWRKKWRIR